MLLVLAEESEQFFTAHKTLRLNPLKCPFVVAYSITFQFCIATQLSACYNIQEPEWWFGLSYCISLSFTLSPSLLLFPFLPIQLLHRLNPDPSSSSFLPISSLHPFLKLFCRISARSPSAQSYRREGQNKEDKRGRTQNGKDVGSRMKVDLETGWKKRLRCDSLLRFGMFLFEENQSLNISLNICYVAIWEVWSENLIYLSTLSPAWKTVTSMAALFLKMIFLMYYSRSSHTLILCILLLHRGPQTYTHQNIILCSESYLSFYGRSSSHQQRWSSASFSGKVQSSGAWRRRLGRGTKPRECLSLFQHSQRCAPIIGSSGWDCQHWVLLYRSEASGGVVSVPLCASTEHIDYARVFLDIPHKCYSPLAMFTFPWFHPHVEIYITLEWIWSRCEAYSDLTVLNGAREICIIVLVVHFEDQIWRYIFFSLNGITQVCIICHTGLIPAEKYTTYKNVPIKNKKFSSPRTKSTVLHKFRAQLFIAVQICNSTNALGKFLVHTLTCSGGNCRIP